MNEARLRWQCRRGMRELDVLLTSFLTESYAGSTPEEKRGFEQLLTLSDPELVGYLLKGERATDPDMERVLSRLRRDPASG
ncbi:MAG: succinate dehydrogenase assembly factor 2 [Pseudomonadota bacterium]